MTDSPQAVQTVHDASEFIEADEDLFSDLGCSIAESDFTSLSSSVKEHVYENGRRYHSLNAGAYVMPNDESEQERLDMTHHCVGLILGGALHVAKLPEKVHRILDLGTGTGIWAIDMADQHPEAQVIGVDLSPIQPSWIPPNCSFEVDDVEKPWLWKEPFDFINSANIAQGIRDWPQYAKNIYDHLTPGGVVQLHEAQITFATDDDSVPKGGPVDRWQESFQKAAKLAGMEEVTDKLESHLLNAGFVDVKITIKKLIVGSWPKDPKKKVRQVELPTRVHYPVTPLNGIIGQWGLAVVERGLGGYGMALFTKVLGMSTEDAKSLCDDAFKQLRDRNVHAYAPLWFVEGRKPEAS